MMKHFINVENHRNEWLKLMIVDGFTIRKALYFMTNEERTFEDDLSYIRVYITTVENNQFKQTYSKSLYIRKSVFYGLNIFTAEKLDGDKKAFTFQSQAVDFIISEITGVINDGNENENEQI